MVLRVINMERVSTDANGVEGNGNSYAPVFSPDGNKIAFTSEAGNLVDGDNNSSIDVFLKDLITGEISRLSANIDSSVINFFLTLF